VLKVVTSGRKLAVAAVLAISLAGWAPVSAFACSGTSGGSASPTNGNVGTAAGAGTTGGSAGVNASGGSGFANPLSTIDPAAATNAAVAGLTLLLGLAALSIWVAVVMLRRRPHAIAATQLSPDGRYWWDGAFWRPVPPRLSEPELEALQHQRSLARVLVV
jgi:hypothetical protein